MTTTQDKITEELQRMDAKDLEAVSWYVIYLKCTPQDREEITLAMLQRIASRKRESMEVYQRDPSLLTGLSVSALRDVSAQTVEFAHRWTVTRFPGVNEFLSAFECLYSFISVQDESISHMELSDVISSLKTVWQTVSTETGTAEQDAARGKADRHDKP